MRRLAQRLIDELNLASSSLELFNEEHLMYLLASQPRRLRDQHAIKGSRADLVSQAIQTGATSTGSTVAVIPKDMLLLPRPSMALTMLSQEVELLLDRLHLSLALGRNSDRDCYFHHC